MREFLDQKKGAIHFRKKIVLPMSSYLDRKSLEATLKRSITRRDQILSQQTNQLLTDVLLENTVGLLLKK
jgi:hypothetical protein